jgi:7-cyano-7-deazaguanine synthase
MLSGGIDSTVALFWAKQKGWDLHALSFKYSGRSASEKRATERIANSIHCRLMWINVSFLKEVADLSQSSAIRRRFGGLPSAYIPSRNLIFYGIASSIAETINARHIVGGHNKNDSTAFPDATTAFFGALNRTTKLGLYSRGKTGRVVNPLASLSKTEVIQLGDRLGVPFELTWSCYRSGNRPCGRCPACKLRKIAFSAAGLVDPLTS